MKFSAPPVSVVFKFKDLGYSLQFQSVSPARLQVIRKFSNNRRQYYAPEDYEGLRAFFEKIVKAEQKFIGYQ